MNGPFRYAGVENGDACYCGNADDKFMPTDPKECNIPCTGAPGQFCGSSWRLQVYDTGTLGDEDVDQPEYTDPPTEAPTTQPETTTSPKTTSPTANAVLILSNRQSANIPLVVDFDGQLISSYISVNFSKEISTRILLSNMKMEQQLPMVVVLP